MYRAVYKKTKDEEIQVVTKHLVKSITEDNLRAFMNNVFLIEHDNLVKIYGAVCNKDDRIIVTEQMQTNLEDFLDENGSLSKIKFKPVALGVAKGLHHLHTYTRPPYTHGGLTSSNVLLNPTPPHQPNNWKVKISDFGRYNLVREPPSLTSALLYGPASTPDGDVYSLGIVMVKMFTNPIPFDAATIRAKTDGIHDRWPSLHQLVTKCKNEDPAKRPPMGEVCKDLEKL